MFFYSLLFLLFLSDIFISGEFQQLPFYLALIFPLIFLGAQIVKRKPIFAPKVSIFYGLFLLFSAASVFFSTDKQIAFEMMLVYIAAFFVFTYVFNHQQDLKQFLKPFIIISSVIFISIFLIDKFLIKILPYGAGLLFPGDNHLQLGNYLVLAALVSFPSFPLFYVFFFSILFSYSRTAYLSISTVIFIFFYNKKRLISTISLVIVSSFFLATSGIIKLPGIDINQGKEMLGRRHIFVNYALSSIKEKPLFGVGPGNFHFAVAKRQFSYNERSSSAHNLIIDLLAENGVIAGSFFILFLFGILKKAKKDLYFYLFMALSVIFLLDYTYRFTSVLFLWFILLGLISENRNKLTFNPLITALFVMICQPIILGHLFSKINPKIALKFYPLHKDTYLNLIEKSISQQNNQEALKYLGRLSHLYGENFIITRRLALYYETFNLPEQSIYFYEKTLKLNPFLVVSDPSILVHLLNINRKLYGGYIGAQKVTYFLNHLFIKDTKANHPVNDRVVLFCQTYKLKCYNY